MKLNLETARCNLNLLKEVLVEFPILQDYIDGKVSRDTISNVGLDTFITLIDYIQECAKSGQKLIYDDTISYKDVKSKIVELNYIERSKNIFNKKTKNQFAELWGDYKLHKRYNTSKNACYAPGLQKSEAIIFNYIAQNEIEVNSEYMFNYREFWFHKISKPTCYAREMKMTQYFVNNFIDYSKSANLDLRKCNIKSLTTELKDKLRDMMLIESGLVVRCISDTINFTVGNSYVVLDSRINYLGFLEINLMNDKKQERYVPYSNFEEISRQREDMLLQLGL